MKLAHLIGRAHQVLDVVTHPMPKHAGGSEIAGSAEVGQFVEDRQVEVDGAVRRTIEGPHRRRTQPAD